MKTLAGPARYEEHIRKSRFLAHAVPVRSQAETLQFYESVADPGASHNCWAWRVDGVYRSNDDGEPSGSAGRPILASIEGRELDGVMVVVTRWFGGIKLGVGGLIRAYGGCAAKCLDRATVIASESELECELQVEFDLVSVAHQLLDQFGADKRGEDFDSDGVRLRFGIGASHCDALQSALADASRGQARLRVRKPSRPGPG